MLRQIIWLLLICGSGDAFAETYRPMKHFERGFSDMPSTRNAWIFGVGTAATIGSVLFLDDDVRDYFKSHEPLGAVAQIGNIAGNGLPTTVLAFGLLGFGLLEDHDREANVGLAMLEATLVETAATQFLKYTVRRERPDGSGNTSFPSGHAARAFSTAGTLLTIYGPAVGIPMLGVAAFVSASRIAVDKHWLSDTIFGGVIGFISGSTFARHHRDVEIGGIGNSAAVLVTPFYLSAREGAGLAARITF